jgi:hypothetical protein
MEGDERGFFALTDNTTDQQSDTSEITTKLTLKKRDRNDIIGRTQLSLSSFWGLEPSLAKKQQSEPGITLEDEVDIGRQITASLPQQSLHLPRSFHYQATEDTGAYSTRFAATTEAEVQIVESLKDTGKYSTRFEATTEAALSIIRAEQLRDTDAKLTIPPTPKQSSADKPHAFFTSIRTLYVVTFIVMFCVIVSGILTYNMMEAGKSGNPGKQNKGGKQSGMNGQMIAPPMLAAQQVSSDIVPSGIKSLQVGVAPSVTIQEYSGNITIHAGGAGSMLIKGTDGQNAAPIRVTQAKGQRGRDAITITPEPISKHVNYDVTVPGSTQVQIVIASGSISIDGVKQVSIDTTSGNLVVKDVSGSVRAHTQNGDITVQNITGPMDIVTVNGSIRGNTIQGQLKAMTQNGDIVLQQAMLSGQSSMKTEYGSIRFTGTLDARGKYTMGTQSGDVELTLPMGAAFQLYGNTRTGTISNEFGNNTTGSAPYAQILVNTQSGSVRVNKG